MPSRVWIGAKDHTPAGWLRCESIDSFLATQIHAEWVIVDDAAAILREADFLRIYAKAPLARIERLISPWRAGIGRTDPSWPLATSRLSMVTGGCAAETVEWVPATASYEELAQAPPLTSLAGVTVTLSIADPELRSVWADTLQLAGAVLQKTGARLAIRDDDPNPPEELEHLELVVRLRIAPWNSSGESSTGGDQNRGEPCDSKTSSTQKMSSVCCPPPIGRSVEGQGQRRDDPQNGPRCRPREISIALRESPLTVLPRIASALDGEP